MYLSKDWVYNGTEIAWEQNLTLLCLWEASSHKLFPVDFVETCLGRRCVYYLSKYLPSSNDLKTFSLVTIAMTFWTFPYTINLDWYGLTSDKLILCLQGEKMYCPLFLFPCRMHHFPFHFETVYWFVHLKHYYYLYQHGRVQVKLIDWT